MAPSPPPRIVKRTIIAQDPSVCANGKIIQALVEVPAETLEPGPRGYRVQVIDYDASTDTYYKPLGKKEIQGDPYRKASDDTLLSDPAFHCLNVYALVMRTLARFEFALGRRVSWGFYGHQLQVSPHAFADANAFYSERDHGLFFGYFRSQDGKRTVHTCLSHDVVVHETTHALLDGLRDHYTDPSSPDQAAFHEGFADVVAMLSVFSLDGVVKQLVDLSSPKGAGNRILAKAVKAKHLRKSYLLMLAEQMGKEMPGIPGLRVDALRRSADLLASPSYYQSDPEFIQPHRRGEILVAAMMNAFLKMWVDRVGKLGRIDRNYLPRDRVVEEGTEIAECLLTVAIRALDYAPPVDIQFGDYLSALLTADAELMPDDTKYDVRGHLRERFAAYGIEPHPSTRASGGIWLPAPEKVSYRAVHFESMRHDPDEVFRFIWENREPEALAIHEEAFSRVVSVRPCVRVGADGFTLRETVVEFIQMLELQAGELAKHGIKKPQGMAADTLVRLYGGNVLVFDEYGRLKFDIHKRLLSTERDQQSKRLKHLWDTGHFHRKPVGYQRFAEMHRQRAFGAQVRHHEQEW